MEGKKESCRDAGLSAAQKLGMPVRPCAQCGIPVFLGRPGQPAELISATVFVDGEVSYVEDHDPGFFCSESCVHDWGRDYVKDKPMLTYVTDTWTSP
jgi:hypothetical protein